MQASRRGLMLNAAAKIPMQLCILFIGVMVFVFYLFHQPPLFFQRLEQARLESPALKDTYGPLKERYDRAFDARRTAAERLLHEAPAGTASDDSAARAFIAANQQLDEVRREAAAPSRRRPAAVGPAIPTTSS